MDQFVMSSQFHAVQRLWQSDASRFSSHNFMYPVFIIDDDESIQPIAAMPQIQRYGVNRLREHLEPLVDKGLRSILIFGVIDKLQKDLNGSNADSKENPVVKALPKLKKWFPSLLIACDVCLCPYTSHGHCGILDACTNGIRLNETVKRIAEIALSYAKAGADVVAPSDAMDRRIEAIKGALIDQGLECRVSILSYAIKTASAFYGPFRQASNCSIAFGNREHHQLPVGAAGLAMRAAKRDICQGADMLIVKPALTNLDLIRKTKDSFPDHLVFAYQVSGEYSLIVRGTAAAENSLVFKDILMETLKSIKRAGADVIITYFTPVILDLLADTAK